MVPDSYGADINYPANELARAAPRHESVTKRIGIKLPSAGDPEGDRCFIRAFGLVPLVGPPHPRCSHETGHGQVMNSRILTRKMLFWSSLRGSF